ncbi:hypothetical protein [Roseivivax isoporae]|uniref:Uncharacterized protein n=1 Tax=Roseivivax isoporae LMG 25204 TaxID=1449351 RepID=X7F7B0_9RHOB|nr:hypothetical protein [Roseivivax isoporae]ETX28588.1 hypothetical protein RISW2_05710 [Roseivivax isoporae LMG 25204]
MILRLLAALPVLLAAWIAILALVLRAGGGAPAVFVPFPPEGLVARLGQGVAVTGASPLSLTLRADGPDLVARTYAAGAWLVLPAGLEACIPAALRKDGPG